jgi:hypothetical protein
MGLLNGITSPLRAALKNLSSTEAGYIDGVTAGTVTANKAVVADENGAVSVIKTEALHIGASGAEVQLGSTPAEIDAVCDKSAAGAVSKIAAGAVTRAADTDPHDSEIVIPAGSIIKGVYVDVQTQEATGGTKTMSVGISGGSGTAFLNAVSVAAAGTVKGTLVNTGQTLGASLCADEDGSGALVPEPYVCTAATTVNYTFGSGDFAELAANIIVEYIDIA